MAYETRRPSKKTLEEIIDWLLDNHIYLYTSNGNLDTGQLDYGYMDIDSAEDVIKIYELNKSDGWKEPNY